MFLQDIVHIGVTDLPSRLPTQSSTLYANNISKFLLSMGEKDHFNINLEDEVVRGAIVLKDGQLLWPAPPAPVSAVPQAQAVRFQHQKSLCDLLNQSVLCFMTGKESGEGRSSTTQLLQLDIERLFDVHRRTWYAYDPRYQCS